MSTTLSFGYKRPDTGDKGSTFYPNLEDNITRLNGHTHDGVDSSQLTAGSVTAATKSVLAAAHTNDGNGNYSQVVSMPTGLQYDEHNVTFRNATTGDQLLLTVEKETATTFTVRINDNSFNLTALFS